MLTLTLLSPERKLLENEQIEEVTFVSAEGEMQVLPGHVPMVGILEPGVFLFRRAAGDAAREKQEQFASGVISSGFFEVADENVSVLAETIELEGEINVERARKAQKVAEEMLQSAEINEQSFKKYQFKLQRSLIRQQFAGKS